PLYHYIDTTGYLAPLGIVCAIIAIYAAIRGRVRDARLWFWFVVAVVAFLLMLGTNTPFYQLIYRVPVLNQFRVPSRHSFEWTLAASVIAAYGWDALEVHAEKKSRKPRRPEMAIIVALFVITGLTGAMWFRAVDVPPTTNPTIFTAL